MADTTADDDFYDDEETLGKADDRVDGAAELPDYVNPEDASDSIYMPERDTTPLEDRGRMDDVDPESNDEHNESSIQGNPEDADADADHPRQAVPQDEKDTSFDNE